MNQLNRELIEFRVIKWLPADETQPAQRSYEKLGRDNGDGERGRERRTGTGTGGELRSLGRQEAGGGTRLERAVKDGGQTSTLR